MDDRSRRTDLLSPTRSMYRSTSASASSTRRPRMFSRSGACSTPEDPYPIPVLQLFRGRCCSPGTTSAAEILIVLPIEFDLQNAMLYAKTVPLLARRGTLTRSPGCTSCMPPDSTCSCSIFSGSSVRARDSISERTLPDPGPAPEPVQPKVPGASAASGQGLPAPPGAPWS